MKLPRGTEEHYCDADSQIAAVRWHDNGIVTMASSEFGVSPVVRAERYIASQRKRMKVPMPNVIHHYNKNMGVVDRMDQNIAQYRPTIRGKKWYFPIISYLISVSVNNAWLFAREGGYKEDLLAFTCAVATSWLLNYGKPQNPGRMKSLVSASLSTRLRYDNIGHHIVQTDPVSRRRCKQCKSNSVQMSKV